ncbi:MAG TPA: hypothetical protein VFE53_22185 [Mucilaginibacter sp.]|jgi:hypothetical protein|nr:hypothetical protein [Mucilaginibacter sp.]
MKSVVFFLFTTFISIACLGTALGAKHPLLLYAIGFGIWVPFIRYCKYRSRRSAERRERERLFQDFMRNGRR